MRTSLLICKLSLKLTTNLAVLCLILTACSTSSTNGPSTLNKQTYYVYLAGPEVFLPDPIAAGAAKKKLIEELNNREQWPFRLIGLYPMDNEIPDFAPNYQTGIQIYKANIELMNKADFVTANMVRFRGPSMDVGTAFEMGYMEGLDKPVFAYYDAEPFYGKREISGLYKEKVQTHYPVAEGGEKDVHGQSIEDFKMADNLMMIGALQSGAGSIAYSFEAAILQIANHLKSNSTQPNK